MKMTEQEQDQPQLKYSTSTGLYTSAKLKTQKPGLSHPEMRRWTSVKELSWSSRARTGSGFLHPAKNLNDVLWKLIKTGKNLEEKTFYLTRFSIDLEVEETGQCVCYHRKEANVPTPSILTKEVKTNT